MKRKAVSRVMLTLLFINMLALALSIQQVEVRGTTYIGAGGSIDLPTVPRRGTGIGAFSVPPPAKWNKTYGGEGSERAFSVVRTCDGGYAIGGYTDSFGLGSGDFWLVKTDAVGNMQWNRTYGSGWNETAEWASSTVQTSDGGYAMVGCTVFEFQPPPPAPPEPIRIIDSWLVKTDSAGNMQWNTTFGGEDDDWAYSVVQTSDGGYAVAGYTKSFGDGSFDFWLVRFDRSGNIMWKKVYNRGIDAGYSVVQTLDGGYAIAGYTYSYPAGSDLWLVKTDSAGNAQWNKTFGVGGGDFAQSLVTTRDGGYAVAGRANNDFWLVKFDKSGNVMWSKTYHKGDIDWGYSVVQTLDGGYAIAGSTETIGGAERDLWLVKTDSAGNMQWNKTYGGPDNDDTYSMVQTSDGGYAIAGATPVPIGDPDMWLIKLGGLSDLTDSDEDGLYDVWETDGIDYDFDGTIDFNLTEANPQHKDIYIEIDYMGWPPPPWPFHDHRPDDSAISSVVNAFANAPVNNPDGVDGITLHIEVDDQFPHQNTINVWDDFDQLKESLFGTLTQRGSANKVNILAAKRLAYRYCLFIHQYSLWIGNQWRLQTSSGIAELPGNDFIVSLGAFANNRGTTREQSGTLMHELGHTLNLRHGGGDDINGKPNYLSLMSYTFQLDWWKTGLFDYSREKLPTLDESKLNETLGIQGPSDGKTVWGDSSLTGNVYVVSTQGPIDWDLNSTIDNKLVVRNINDFAQWAWGDPYLTILEGYDDWTNLRYNFRFTSEFSDGVHVQTEQNEVTYEMDYEMKNAHFIGFHDVAITNIEPFKTVVEDGHSTPINITVANQGYYTETFNITLYANTTLIASQTHTLTSGNSTTITFTWNTTGFAKGHYTINAYATQVPSELDTIDNTCTDGSVIVTIPGDLNGDFKCNYKDLFILAVAYGSDPTKPNWNPYADINDDGRVNYKDLYILATNYGKSWP